jgi:membrane protein
VIIVFLIGLLYRIVPDVKISWRDVWWGSLLTTFFTGVVLAVLRIYLDLSSFGAAYGAAGSLVALLFIVYIGAQMFIFGAEFTQVYANRYGSRATDNREPG